MARAGRGPGHDDRPSDDVAASAVGRISQPRIVLARRELDAGWRMPFAPSGSAQLAYHDAGDGPPVLLIHAGVTDKRSWAPLVDALGGRYRTIAYDQRGYGQTTYTAEPHSSVGDATAVLDAAGVESAIVIGCSNGGRRSVDLALAHPSA